ncbi:hypothetical protein SAMN04488028_10640 [Reichenbachiella agariperforans]|uniref:Uncharacterized protein n=1 Tax=Reichenbachiella agariperforans TaxID=156994 RepID=A0A1M6TGV0_REIAG|nr:hypothetical protein [Reichenbachiella agariperforans]SHK56262.1 hypothetical protein SAMN04488028_10640 [Reichenbachiella agariperforans]
MEILKPNQEVYYQTQLSETEISERINNLLDSKQQTAPNVFGGTYKQNKLEIYNVKVGLWLTPVVRGTLSNGQLNLSLKPSKQFKFAVFMMIFVTFGLLTSLILGFRSEWYILPFQTLIFLIVVNFGGLSNYRNITETLERTLELTEKKEDNNR